MQKPMLVLLPSVALHLADAALASAAAPPQPAGWRVFPLAFPAAFPFSEPPSLLPRTSNRTLPACAAACTEAGGCQVGLGRIVALHYRPSTSYQIR
jgi:hypothetical protein